jgi:hypothetical protein
MTSTDDVVTAGRYKHFAEIFSCITRRFIMCGLLSCLDEPQLNGQSNSPGRQGTRKIPTIFREEVGMVTLTCHLPLLL